MIRIPLATLSRIIMLKRNKRMFLALEIKYYLILKIDSSIANK